MCRARVDQFAGRRGCWRARHRLQHRTGGGAPRIQPLVCTGPSNYRNFTCQ